MDDMCTLSREPLPPPSYAEVQKKDRRDRVAKRIVACCVVVVAFAVGWYIPDLAYIRARGNTEVNYEVYVTSTDWRVVYVTQTNTLEVYVTRTNGISPTGSSECATVTHTLYQNVYVTSMQVQTVIRHVKPTPRPTEKPICPYTYPAGYKDGQNDRTRGFGQWGPRFRRDEDYKQGYFEGFYDYTPYCISSQRLSF